MSSNADFLTCCLLGTIIKTKMNIKFSTDTSQIYSLRPHKRQLHLVRQGFGVYGYGHAFFFFLLIVNKNEFSEDLLYDIVPMVNNNVLLTKDLFSRLITC